MSSCPSKMNTTGAQRRHVLSCQAEPYQASLCTDGQMWSSALSLTRHALGGFSSFFPQKPLYYCETKMLGFIPFFFYLIHSLISLLNSVYLLRCPTHLLHTHTHTSSPPAPSCCSAETLPLVSCSGLVPCVTPLGLRPQETTAGSAEGHCSFPSHPSLLFQS